MCVCDNIIASRLGHVQVHRGKQVCLLKQLERVFLTHTLARSTRLVPPEVTGPFGQLLTPVTFRGPGSVTMLVFVNPVMVSPKRVSYSAQRVLYVSCWRVYRASIIDGH